MGPNYIPYSKTTAKGSKRLPLVDRLATIIGLRVLPDYMDDPARRVEGLVHRQVDRRVPRVDVESDRGLVDGMFRPLFRRRRRRREFGLNLGLGPLPPPAEDARQAGGQRFPLE